MNFLENIQTAFAIGFCSDTDLKILSIEKKIIILESECEIVDDSLIRLAVFNFKTYSYDEFSFQNCRILDSEIKEFSYIYRVELGNLISGNTDNYFSDVKDILEVNISIIEDHYNKQKLEFIEQYHDVYPDLMDNIFFSSFYEQERFWYTYDNIQIRDYTKFKEITSRIEMAFNINNHIQYRQFDEMNFSEAIKMNIVKGNIKEHGIFSNQFSRIYIGNEFCPNLFPNESILFRILDKAISEGYKVTISFPFLRQSFVKSTLALLDKLEAWSDRKNIEIEIVVNEWGMLYLVGSKYTKLTPVLGRLLNRRKKDPRLLWKWGWKGYKNQFSENNLNCNHFIDFLNKNRIYRFEFEAYSLNNKIPDGKHSIHFPFYQLNTSEYCLMYADCKYMNRNKQSSIDLCPAYCQDFYYKYPKHLNIIGKGNSVFGFDNRIFLNPNLLSNYIENGIDRLVYST